MSDFCLLCLSELPPRRWWQWTRIITGPPPFCPLCVDALHSDDSAAFRARIAEAEF